MVRVSAVIIDNTIVDPRPTLVEFTHSGDWHEALDQVYWTYISEHRGGQRVDAERLELRSCCIMRVQP